MPKPLKRETPELFDGQWAEHRVARARFHIGELRERLDQRGRDRRDTACDAHPGATHPHHTD